MARTSAARSEELQRAELGLVMAMAGRWQVLDELAGDGLSELRSRLAVPGR